MTEKEIQPRTSSGSVGNEQSNMKVVRKLVHPIASLVAVLTLMTVLVTSCSGTSSQGEEAKTTAEDTVTTSEPVATRATGKRVEALDFPVAPSTQGLAASSPTETVSATKTTPSSTPVEAVDELISSAIAKDFDSAWAQVASADQARIGFPQRLVEEFNAVGWTSFTIADSNLDTVTVNVKQTAKISEIDGVVSSQAIVRIKTIAESGGFKVLWSRRVTEQLFPEMNAVENLAVQRAVMSWAAARQACELQPSNQYSSGLVGVVGLADALCKTVGAPSIGEVQDIYGLDEPEPLIQAFGGSASSWARVVSINAPVPMNVVVAPKGKDWIVVAVARLSIS